MIRDITKYALSNIWNRKLRSFLSVLSIMIGITAIFALASFGLGMQYFVEDFGKQMGTDKIMIMPKDFMTAAAESNVEFDDEDLEFIKKVNGVDGATGMVVTYAKVGFKDYRPTYPFVMGFSTEAEEMRLVEETFSGIDIIDGRALKEGDVYNSVLGYNYRIPERIFDKGVKVGDEIKINDIEVEAVGFYEEVGNPEDDRNVYLSLEGAEEILKKENYIYILVRSSAAEDPTELADEIKEDFRQHRNQEEGQEDFVVQTFEQVMETYTSILNIIVSILVLIALVSVVVAAVNIMNTMYTSIMERTREIGVMKSIGARNNLILGVFMVEAGALGIIGGILGVVFGYAVAKAGGLVATYYGIGMLQPYFPSWLIMGCLLFAFAVGAGAGVFPARQAAKLKPVDALRYE